MVTSIVRSSIQFFLANNPAHHIQTPSRRIRTYELILCIKINVSLEASLKADKYLYRGGKRLPPSPSPTSLTTD